MKGFLLLISIILPVHAAVYIVDPAQTTCPGSCTPSCQYIQCALDIASPGDVIVLEPGVHVVQPSKAYVADVNKAITLISRRDHDTPAAAPSYVDCLWDGAIVSGIQVTAAARIEGITVQQCQYTGTAIGAGMRIMSNANPTLVAMHIRNNVASFYGGGVYVDAGSSPTLDGCTLEGNVADGGGGIMINGGTLTGVTTLNNCMILGNQARIGGGVFVYDTNPPATVHVIQNGVLANNTATENGGAVNIYGASISLLDSNCTHNTAAQYGGAWYVSGAHNAPGHIGALRVLLSHNTATMDGGGAMATSRGTLHINASIVEYNVAGGDGGGVVGSTVASNSQFRFNQASVHAGGGGALWLNQGTLWLGQCRLENNKASFGGALALSGDASGVMISTWLQDNIAKSNHLGGGGIAVMDQAHMVCTECHALRNHADGAGGVLFLEESAQLNWTIGNLTQCDAEQGGAIYVSGTTRLVLIQLIVTQCQSSMGGGSVQLLDASQITVRNSVWFNNTALGGPGGAFYVHRNALLSVYNSVFSYHSGQGGGAIASIDQSVFTCEDCSLHHNVAQGSDVWEYGGAGDGGAIWSMKAHLVRVTMEWNQAHRAGGSLVIGEGSLYDVHISNSSAGTVGGGLLLGPGGCAHVTWDNTTVVESCNATRAGNHVYVSLALAPDQALGSTPPCTGAQIQPATLCPGCSSMGWGSDVARAVWISDPPTQFYPSTSLLSSTVYLEDAYGGVMNDAPASVVLGQSVLAVVSSTKVLVDAQGQVVLDQVQVEAHADVQQVVVRYTVPPSAYGAEATLSAVSGCAEGYGISTVEVNKLSMVRCTLCEEGTYNVGGGSAAACHVCPQGTTCHGAEINSHKGWWVYRGTDAAYSYRCPEGLCEENNQCVGNRDISTPLCGGCPTGQTLVGGLAGDCRSCPVVGVGLWMSILLCGVYVIVQHWLLSHPAQVDGGGGVSASSYKIFFYFAQTVPLVTASSEWGSFFSALNFRPAHAAWCVVGELGAYGRFAVNMAVPFVMLLWMGVIYLWEVQQDNRVHAFSVDPSLSDKGAELMDKSVDKEEEEEEDLPAAEKKYGHGEILNAKERCVRTLYAILLFCYAGITQNALEMVRCRVIGDTAVLASDPGIVCKGGYWGAFAAAMVIILGFVCGVPLWLFKRLWGWRVFDFDFRSTRHEQVHGFLYGSYDAPKMWWDVYVLIRRGLHIALFVALFEFGIYRAMSVSALCVLALITHSLMTPFIKRSDNAMEALTLLLLTLIAWFDAGTQFRSSLEGLSEEEVESRKVMQSVGMGLMAFVPIVLWIAVMLGQQQRRAMEKRQRKSKKKQ